MLSSFWAGTTSAATCVPTPFFPVGCFPNKCPKVLLVSLLLIMKRLHTHFWEFGKTKTKRRKWPISIIFLPAANILVGVTQIFCGWAYRLSKNSHTSQFPLLLEPGCVHASQTHVCTWGSLAGTNCLGLVLLGSNCPRAWAWDPVLVNGTKEDVWGWVGVRKIEAWEEMPLPHRPWHSLS